MKYFLKRTYSSTYGTFGTCVNVGWLNTNDIVGFRIDRHSRTALDKETLDKIRARLSLLDTELVTADGFGKIKIIYEEIPADGLHEEYSDEIKAKAGEKGVGAMNEKQNFTEGKHTVEDGVVEFYDNAVCEVRGGKARGAEKRWGMSDKIKKCPLRKDAPKTIKAQYDPNKVLPMACPICRQNAHSSEMYLTAPDGKYRLNVLYYYACYTCSMPEMIELRHTDQAAIAEWNNWVKKYLEAQKEGGE